jgi:uncharacterized BrkB/YihY/UPF0761 family membrane protein
LETPWQARDDTDRHCERGWKDIVARVKRQISEDNISMIAASMAFWRS